MIKLFPLLFLTFFMSDAQSQTLDKDSLLNELKTAREDSNKVILYRILAITLADNMPGEAVNYGKAGVQLGLRLKYDRGVAGCYLNVSYAYSNAGRLDSALLYIDSAILWSLKVGEPARLALAYLNRGDYNMRLWNLKQSLADCDTALRYAVLADNKDRIARIYLTMGNTYFSQSKLPESLDYYERTAKLYAEIGNQKMYASALNNIGNVFTRNEKYQQAIENYQRAITIAENADDQVRLSMYYGNMSSAYTRLGQYDKAEASAHTAMDHAVRQQNETQTGYIYNYLGLIYLARKEYSKSVTVAAKAWDIMQEAGLQEEQRTAADILADAYTATGNYKEANKYLTESRKLSDSLAKQKFDKEVAALQTSFRFEEKNTEITLLKKDGQLQQQRLYRQRLLIGGSFLLTALATAGIFLLISRHRLRQRVKEVELRNSIAADLHDEVGSSLSSIYMLSKMAGTPGASTDSQHAVLNKVTSYSKETMDKMGDIVWMIKQHDEDGKDLQERMHRFLYEMCSSKNISSHFEGDLLKTLKLTTEQKKALYLIFKEAVNNALKYASPHHINVMISKKQNQIELKIADDGSGFDVLSANKGNGLENMQNRAKELGGKTKIISSEKGTTVLCTLPLKANHNKVAGSV